MFSPHTSWDAVQGGVNDWLTEALPVKLSSPIIENALDPSVGAGRICKLSEEISLKEAVERIKKHIGIPHLRLALAKNKSICKKIATISYCNCLLKILFQLIPFHQWLCVLVLELLF